MQSQAQLLYSAAAQPGVWSWVAGNIQTLYTLGNWTVRECKDGSLLVSYREERHCLNPVQCMTTFQARN